MRPGVLWAAAAAGVLVVLFLTSRRGVSPILTPETRAELDRLRTAHVRDSTMNDSLMHEGRAAAAKGDSAADRARALERAAVLNRGQAEALAAEARRLETSAASAAEVAARWKAAYEARSAEVVQLRASLAAKDTAIAEKDAAVARFQLAAQHAEERAAERQRALDRIEADVTRAAEAQKCRVLRLFDCPTRTESAALAAAGGMLLGGLVTAAVK